MLFQLISQHQAGNSLKLPDGSICGVLFQHAHTDVLFIHIRKSELLPAAAVADGPLMMTPMTPDTGRQESSWMVGGRAPGGGGGGERAEREGRGLKQGPAFGLTCQALPWQSMST